MAILSLSLLMLQMQSYLQLARNLEEEEGEEFDSYERSPEIKFLMCSVNNFKKSVLVNVV